MRTILIAIVLIVLLIVGRIAFMIIPASGALADLEPLGLEGCTPLTIAPGTEDVTIHPLTGRVYVSTAERRTDDASGNGIWAFDLFAPDASLQRISVDAPQDFHPHGISLLLRPDNADRLFVINHRSDGTHGVEIFEIGEDGVLTHIETITYPALESPNDIVAVDSRRFYATNDRKYAGGIMAQLEAFLGLPLSSVSYFDGEAGRIVADGLQYANGINLSADGGTIYVTEFLGRRLDVYARNGQTGALQRTRRIGLATGADNIEMAADGSLWIGSHPRVFDFLAHATDPAVISPSEVIRVDPESGTVTRELVALEGELNASSVGAVFADTLVVGAVFDDRVLICPRD